MILLHTIQRNYIFIIRTLINKQWNHIFVKRIFVKKKCHLGRITNVDGPIAIPIQKLDKIIMAHLFFIV